MQALCLPTIIGYGKTIDRIRLQSTTSSASSTWAFLNSIFSTFWSQQWIKSLLMSSHCKSSTCFGESSFKWPTLMVNQTSQHVQWFSLQVQLFHDLLILPWYCYNHTLHRPLLFIDPFHKMRQLIDAFNDYYAAKYTPPWLNCINKSMNSCVPCSLKAESIREWVPFYCWCRHR